ncbi:MAG: twin-arginine translocation signal domain-containing protein [Saprospiraceae bacterium]|nr:twin-arginine translocation signal domain-containing protein [Candidatus Vicinibacter affinis]
MVHATSIFTINRPNMNRRKFIKKSALAAAGTVGFPYLLPTDCFCQTAFVESRARRLCSVCRWIAPTGIGPPEIPGRKPERTNRGQHYVQPAGWEATCRQNRLWHRRQTKQHRGGLSN